MEFNELRPREVPRLDDFFKRRFEFGSAQPFWVFVGAVETIVVWVLYCNVDIVWCLFNLFCYQETAAVLHAWLS